ncbi:expressed unknown protein [Seminavis robusta]|uniref:Phthiocerol/phthiodiolone dimycocerosyl transferase C-terminal domain-containing protein n=1 Tax=Seminavis robusta TaxID=568900 RepID=A0A9N8HL04_9STRA|nr:expressed unknown protein [Seminavis robusta]|eukprot:Sro650_g181350.1 n/a (498) ;mRNA; f:10369-11862
MIMRKGIWFGKLSDGTEASIGDMVSQELTVVQAARVRLVGHQRPLDHNATVAVAQYLRQRYPELNREEQPSQYTEAGFTRRTLPEVDAANAVRVTVAPPSVGPEKCQEKALALMNGHVLRHPSSFSRLGWCIDVLHSQDGNDCLLWVVLTMSHSHSDGVGMQVLVSDFLDAYLLLLIGDALPSRERLPLFSSLPRERTSLSWGKQVGYGFLGWMSSKLMAYGGPAPMLLTPAAKEHAAKIKEDRLRAGKLQNEGPMHVEFVELDAASTKQLCAHARSVGLTVGSLVHGALFVALAKRYFQEHPEAKKLELEIPLSVNMRKFLNPPLPGTVLAPQQGELQIKLRTTRLEVDQALASHKAMIPLIHKIALDSRTKVQADLAKPEKLKALDFNITTASILRNSKAEQLGAIQYIGDAWLSNVGLFRPSERVQRAGRLIQVETTLTLNPTIMPAYELVWSNTVAGGSMALSMVTDETMGRNKASSRALLQDMANLLQVLVH